jgi:hypothetical protein
MRHRQPLLILLPLLALALLGAAQNVQAQTPVTSGQHFLWDEPAPDAATAAGYTYRYYTDNAATGTIFAGVTCVTSSTAGAQTCTVLIPAFTPGVHTVTLTAATSPTGTESAKSSPITFTMIFVPAPPANFRVGP